MEEAVTRMDPKALSSTAMSTNLDKSYNLQRIIDKLKRLG
jgi:hypothetical protein